MTEPLRSDARAAETGAQERDREAVIENLLLGGLDHYFAGQHELAINVWTRVLFLDRGHARARAYIERARAAVSERQREGEELVHTGAAAFQRGEADAARQLLTSAVERGAATDEALALLQRLDRLDFPRPQAPVSDPRPGSRSAARTDGHATPAGRGWSIGSAAAALAVIAGALLVVAVLAARVDDWLPVNGGSPPQAVGPGPEEPLPVLSASDVWVARARAFYSKGRLREALEALDSVRPGDPARGRADELRATIQRQLLAAARGVEPHKAGAAASPRDGTGRH